MPNVMAMQNEFVGNTYHYLSVIAIVPHGVKALRLLCKCKCGNTTLAAAHQIRSREKTSCGCWKHAVLGERSKTHGRANSRTKGYADRTYGIWQAMRDRCTNPNRKDFYRYGGRGIIVCERWSSFECFLADMGEAPANLTLDRIDNNKEYSPDNCRWATRLQQTYNSTSMIHIEHDGVVLCLRAWQEKQNVKQHTYYARRKRGWTIEEALLLKPRIKNAQAKN